jgi:hypothetical protein
MRVTSAKAGERYKLEVAFDDDTVGVVDLSHLARRGVFVAWEAPGAFEDLAAGSGGEVVWSCGVDLCADALYLLLTGKEPADIFPALGREPRCA